MLIRPLRLGRFWPILDVMYLVVSLTKCSRETFCCNLFQVPCNFLLNSLAYNCRIAARTDAVYSNRSDVVILSVCLSVYLRVYCSVCLLVTSLSCAKTAEPSHCNNRQDSPDSPASWCRKQELWYKRYACMCRVYWSRSPNTQCNIVPYLSSFLWYLFYCRVLCSRPISVCVRGCICNGWSVITLLAAWRSVGGVRQWTKLTHVGSGYN